MPPEAATDNVPDRVPPLGFVPMAMFTVAVEPVTRLLFASWIWAVTGGEMATPAVVGEDGCWPNTTLVGAPGVMLNAMDVVAVRVVHPELVQEALSV